MAGGLIQLVAYGAQDLYLSGNPQITFFKTVYKRHTNFAMEFIKLYFATNPTIDAVQYSQGTVNLTKFADLAHDTYLVIDLPDIWGPYASGFRWVDNLGYIIINYVTLTIGGAQIDKQYGEWMFIWNELTITDERKKHLKKLMSVSNYPFYTLDNDPSNTTAPHTPQGSVTQKVLLLPRKRIYIPLDFWFCLNPGLALPLIALKKQEVSLNFEFSPINYWYTLGSQNMSPVKFFQQGAEGFPAVLSNTPIVPPLPPANQNWDQQIYSNYASLGLNHANIFNYFLDHHDNTSGTWTQNLYVESNYIYLDNDERDKFKNNSQEYLINQVQRREYKGLPSGANNLWIKIDYPVKEFFWFFQRQDVGIYNNFLNFTSLLNSQTYLKQIEFIKTIAQYGTGNFIAFLRGSGPTTSPTLVNIVNTHFQQLLEHDMHINPHNVVNSLVNAMETCKFLFNGKDRFDEKDHIFFEHLQPFVAHTGYSQHPGIYNFTFSLNPEKFQPSGTCNMSKIEKFQMQFVLKAPYNIDLVDATTGITHSDINPSTNITSNYSHSSLPANTGATQNLNIGAETKYDMHFFTTNYNILRVMGGMGNVAFSN